MDFDKIVSLEINEKKHIIDFSVKEQLSFTEKEDFVKYAEFMLKRMKHLSSSHRWYFLFDMTNFIVDPCLSELYSKFAEKMYRKYIYPDGAARYGSAITRVTVKISHEKILKKEANIFRNREEAVRYIYDLIDSRENIELSETFRIPVMK